MFKTISSLFLEDTAPAKPEPAKVEPAKADVKAEPVMAPPVIYGAPDPKIIELIEQTISKADLPGFDYLEFRKSFDSMSAAALTDQQKMTAIFATAQVMGATKESLIGAIDHYLKVLDGLKKEFVANAERAKEIKVVARQNSISEIESKIVETLAKVEELNRSIQESRVEQAKLQEEIKAEQLSISNTSASFESAYSNKVRQLSDDRQKMEAYL